MAHCDVESIRQVAEWWLNPKDTYGALRIYVNIFLFLICVIGCKKKNQNDFGISMEEIRVFLCV
jgi:hypothetical protein